MVARSFALALTVTAVIGCSVTDNSLSVEGSGTAASEERAPGEFSSVRFALPGVLVLEQGAPALVLVEGDDNILEHVNTEVRQGTLRIGSGSTRLRPRTALRVVVRAPEFEAIESAGSGIVEAAGLRGAGLTLSVAGSGDALRVRARWRCRATRRTRCSRSRVRGRSRRGHSPPSPPRRASPAAVPPG
jgi:hypothetical protein